MYNHAYNLGAMLGKVKKWGNSLGLVVPAEVARGHGLREGDVVEFEIRRRVPSLEELAGTVKFRIPLKKLLKEMEEGWDDS